MLVSSYGLGASPLVSSIRLSNATNVVVSDLTLTGSRTLITVRGGSGNTVTRCTLSNAGTYAAYVSDSPDFTFSNNSYATTGSFAQFGKVIIVQGTVSGAYIFGNTITLNNASKIVSGIYVVDVNGALSRQYDNRRLAGIGVKGTHRNVVDAQVYRNSIYHTDTRAGDGESIEYTGIHRYTVTGRSTITSFRDGNTRQMRLAYFTRLNVAAYGNVVIGPLANTAFHFSSSSYGGLAYGNTFTTCQSLSWQAQSPASQSATI